MIEVLFGLQQRCAAERRTSHKLLRTICDDMRRQQVTTIAEFMPAGLAISLAFLSCFVCQDRSQKVPSIYVHEHNPHLDEDSYVRRGLQGSAPSRQC